MSSVIDFAKEVQEAKTAGEVKTLLSKYLEGSPDFENFDDEDSDSGEALKRIETVLTEEFSEGGHEGGGEHAEKVFKHIPTNTYWRKTGYYASYAGTTWDGDWTQVEAYQEPVTKYRVVK